MASKTESLIPVIMCGGSGSRLWPLSRAQLPKPYVSLPNGSTLLRETMKGLVTRAQEFVVITAVSQVADVKAAYSLSGLKIPMRIIAEPCSRNTGPVAAVAAKFITARYGKQVNMVLLAADHLIADRNKFWQAIVAANKAANKGQLALLGIRPSWPATDYGYIQAEVVGKQGWAPVKRFCEKPDATTAAQMIASGNYYWNAGVFVVAAEQLLKEFIEHQPAIAKLIAKLKPPASGDWNLDEASYQKFPAISLDYAIAEKTTNAAVAPALDTGWSDVGSWHAFAEQFDQDGKNNLVNGEVMAADASDNIVYGLAGRLIALAGVSGVTVIDTADALLVAGNNSENAVKTIYQQLAKVEDLRAISPSVERRPWGSYQVLSVGTGFKLKRIDVMPGQRLSLQSHVHRSEHWTTLEGVMTITIDDRTFDQTADQSCHIPQGAKHRMANNTKQGASIIELQLGDYLGEDDIQRFEDDYQRS